MARSILAARDYRFILLIPGVAAERGREGLLFGTVADVPAACHLLVSGEVALRAAL